jgi:hypothetical protein
MACLEMGYLPRFGCLRLMSHFALLFRFGQQQHLGWLSQLHFEKPGRARSPQQPDRLSLAQQYELVFV